MSSGPDHGGQPDSWCVVALDTGDEVLFGYALHQEETGGLAWLSSTVLLGLNRAAPFGRMASGRRYRHGRRFNAVDVGAEGEEARLAFHLLVGAEFEDLDDLKEVDRSWLMARKAARHLGVEAPVRTDAATRALSKRHGDPYLAFREQTGRQTS